MGGAGWQLQIEGAPQLVSEDAAAGRPALPLHEKDAAWLAYVALEGPVPSRDVAALVWPGRPEPTALNNLRQRISKLRRLTGGRLLTMSTLLALADDLRCAPRAALSPDPAAPAPPPLLATGRYDDCPDFAAWLAQQRHSRDVQAGAAWEAAAVAAEAAGDLARAVACAARALQALPRAEPHVRRLMRLHYLRGDVAAAVAAFEVFEQSLREELGLRPSAETQELLQLVERAQAPAPLPARAVPVALLRPPVTVGRDDSAAWLRQAVQDRQVALVVGEAGIGKTRLLADLADPQSLHAHARPGDRTVPFALFDRLLAAAAARWPQAQPALGDEVLLAAVRPGAAAARAGARRPAAAELARRAEAALRALHEHGCRCVVADDLHFADAASLELLAPLVLSEPLAGLAWVLAHRPLADDDPEAPLLRALAEAPRVRLLRLGPLDEAALAALVDTVLVRGSPTGTRWAAELRRRSGGNPLFALETLREALAHGGLDAPLPLPRGLEHLLRARLERLSPAALALARVAAVAGPDLSVELAAHVLEQPVMSLAGAWHELEQADVLSGAAFAHDLVHDAMRQLTPAVVARAAHRRVADFLHAAGAAPARVAPHWDAAGEHRRAAEAWRAAATQARAAGRAAEGTAFLEAAAVAAAAAGDGAQAFRDRRDAALSALTAAGVAEAQRRAEALAAAARDAGEQASAAVVCATVDLMRGDGPAALAQAERAARLAPADDTRLQMAAALARARALSIGPQAAQAWPALAPWVGHIDLAETPDERFALYAAAFGAAFGANAVQAIQSLGERHLALALGLGREDEEVTARMNLSLAQMRLGRPAEAAAQARGVDRLLARDGLTPGLAVWNRIQLGIMVAGQGGYAEALALLQQGRETLARDDPHSALRPVAEDFLGALYLQLGQLARAHQRSRDDAPGVGAVQRARRLVLRAQVAQAMGQDPRPALEAARALCGEQGPADTRLAIGIELARCGPPEAAPEGLAAMERLAQDTGFPVMGELAAGLRLAALCDDPRSPAAALAEAAARVEAGAACVQGFRVYFPGQMLACCRAYRRLGRDLDARRCLQAGLDWVARVVREELAPEQRDAFRSRNGVNAALAALQATWRGDQPPM